MLAVTFACACSGSGADEEAQTQPADASDAAASDDAIAMDDGPFDAMDTASDAVDTRVDAADGATDAIDAMDAGPTTLTVYPPVGAPSDGTVMPKGPGLVLMGGGPDVDDAFVWAHDVLAGSASGDGGDVVVLRATGTNAYDAYLAGLAKFHSVRTLLLPPPSTAADLAIAATYVDKAEMVFFAGGNQADYVRWKGSPLMTAVRGVYARGGVVGGTSAGCTIEGPLVFDAIAAGGKSVQSSDALSDPFEAPLSFTRDLFAWPSLAHVVTDPHFHERDRFGRLATFMARQFADGAVTDEVIGVGIDEGNALVIDAAGRATLKQQTSGKGAAFVVRGGTPDIVKSGEPLLYRDLSVERLDVAGRQYDFAKKCGTGTLYRVDVDGAASTPTSPADAYGAHGTVDACK